MVKVVQLNGSPELVFDFDEELTWFQVKLPIHPNFVQRESLVIDLKVVIWDLRGIDRLLNNILEKAGILKTRDIARDIAGDIAGEVKHIDLLTVDQAANIPDDTAGDIASNQAD